LRFKSTYNIFTDFGEVFDPSWMDSDTLQLPPKKDWDYSRELTIEDVDIWEVIWEAGGGQGLYASWSPYAEFYLLSIDGQINTLYGPNAQKELIQKIKELNLPVSVNKIWVEPEDMWLYSEQEN
jgi:hypothetical protein